jgi:hypothetical protein
MSAGEQFAPIDKPYFKQWQDRQQPKPKPAPKVKRQHHMPARKQAK